MKYHLLRLRIGSSVLFTVAVGSVFTLCFAAQGETIGSPVIRRQFSDIDFGQVYIYKGGAGPFQSQGRISTWAFFDDRNAGLSVTPLIFKVTGKDTFTLTGVGTTRVSAGTGLQSSSFDLIAGSGEVSPGLYTFGFANRPYTIKGTALVAGKPNTGVIAIDRPSATIPNDRWIVTAEASSGGAITLNIGTKIGGDGIPIYNQMDPGGLDRVYAAQATVLARDDSQAPNLVAPAVRTAVVRSTTLPEPAELAPLGSDRTFGHVLPSGIGLTHRIEASTDLVNWVAATNIVLHFKDLDSTRFDRRFYRFSLK